VAGSRREEEEGEEHPEHPYTVRTAPRTFITMDFRLRITEQTMGGANLLDQVPSQLTAGQIRR